MPPYVASVEPSIVTRKREVLVQIDNGLDYEGGTVLFSHHNFIYDTMFNGININVKPKDVWEEKQYLVRFSLSKLGLPQIHLEFNVTGVRSARPSFLRVVHNPPWRNDKAILLYESGSVDWIDSLVRCETVYGDEVETDDYPKFNNYSISLKPKAFGHWSSEESVIKVHIRNQQQVLTTEIVLFSTPEFSGSRPKYMTPIDIYCSYGTSWISYPMTVKTIRGTVIHLQDNTLQDVFRIYPASMWEPYNVYVFTVTRPDGQIDIEWSFF
jgi:hypothetical protein